MDLSIHNFKTGQGELYSADINTIISNRCRYAIFILLFAFFSNFQFIFYNAHYLVVQKKSKFYYLNWKARLRRSLSMGFWWDVLWGVWFWMWPLILVSSSCLGHQHKPMSPKTQVLLESRQLFPWTKKWQSWAIPGAVSARPSHCNRKSALNKEHGPGVGSWNVSVQPCTSISQQTHRLLQRARLDSWLGCEPRIRLNVNWHWGVTWGSFKGCAGKPCLFLFPALLPLTWSSINHEEDLVSKHRLIGAV